MENPINEDSRLGTMPMNWCLARRNEVRAYLNSDGYAGTDRCRTMLIELLAQIKALDMQAAAHHRALQALSAAHAGELAGQALAHRQEVAGLKSELAGLKDELAAQEVEKLAMVREQEAIISALQLVNAGHVDKAQKAIQLLMQFPEYAEAQRLLTKAMTAAAPLGPLPGAWEASQVPGMPQSDAR